jgi:hypothetical protein
LDLDTVVIALWPMVSPHNWTYLDLLNVIRPPAQIIREMVQNGGGIHQRCARLLECLPALQHDPNRPEDVLKVDADEDGVGDCADFFRYLVATRARTISQRKLRGL